MENGIGCGLCCQLVWMTLRQTANRPIFASDKFRLADKIRSETMLPTSARCSSERCTSRGQGVHDRSVGYGQLPRILETELQKGFARYGHLFALLGCGDNGSCGQTSERSDASSFTPSRYASNERSKTGATQDLLGCFTALALSLDFIVGGRQGICGSVNNDIR